MNLVFICTGNTCRSPMAAELMRQCLDKQGRQDIIVESAGLSAYGEPASSYAVQVMAEWGFDISSHISHPLTSAICEKADQFAVMSNRHASVLTTKFRIPAENIYILGGETGIPDPYGGTLEEYRRTRDSLQDAVTQLLPYLPPV